MLVKHGAGAVMVVSLLQPTRIAAQLPLNHCYRAVRPGSDVAWSKRECERLGCFYDIHAGVEGDDGNIALVSDLDAGTYKYYHVAAGNGVPKTVVEVPLVGGEGHSLRRVQKNPLPVQFRAGVSATGTGLPEHFFGPGAKVELFRRYKNFTLPLHDAKLRLHRLYENLNVMLSLRHQHPNVTRTVEVLLEENIANTHSATMQVVLRGWQSTAGGRGSEHIIFESPAGSGSNTGGQPDVIEQVAVLGQAILDASIGAGYDVAEARVRKLLTAHLARRPPQGVQERCFKEFMDMLVLDTGLPLEGEPPVFRLVPLQGHAKGAATEEVFLPAAHFQRIGGTRCRPHRVLVPYITCGNGHKSAARAIEEALRLRPRETGSHLQTEVMLIDVSEDAPDLVTTEGRHLYHFPGMANNLIRTFFPVMRSAGLKKHYEEIIDFLHERRERWVLAGAAASPPGLFATLGGFLDDYAPDVVVSTSPLTVRAVQQWAQKRRAENLFRPAPVLLTVMTDYLFGGIVMTWLSNPLLSGDADRIFVGAEHVKREMVQSEGVTGSSDEHELFNWWDRMVNQRGLKDSLASAPSFVREFLASSPGDWVMKAVEDLHSEGSEVGSYLLDTIDAQEGPGPHSRVVRVRHALNNWCLDRLGDALCAVQAVSETIAPVFPGSGRDPLRFLRMFTWHFLKENLNPISRGLLTYSSADLGRVWNETPVPLRKVIIRLVRRVIFAMLREHVFVPRIAWPERKVVVSGIPVSAEVTRLAGFVEKMSGKPAQEQKYAILADMERRAGELETGEVRDSVVAAAREVISFFRQEHTEGCKTLLLLPVSEGAEISWKVWQQVFDWMAANPQAPLQVLAVAGRAAELETKARTYVQNAFASSLDSQQKKVLVLGFSRILPHLMALSDVILSKPGGLTVAESLPLGCGWLLLGDLAPDVERYNVRYLETTGAGVVGRSDSVANSLLQPLFQQIGSSVPVVDVAASAGTNVAVLGLAAGPGADSEYPDPVFYDVEEDAEPQRTTSVEELRARARTATKATGARTVADYILQTLADRQQEAGAILGEFSLRNNYMSNGLANVARGAKQVVNHMSNGLANVARRAKQVVAPRKREREKEQDREKAEEKEKEKEEEGERERERGRRRERTRKRKRETRGERRRRRRGERRGPFLPGRFSGSLTPYHGGPVVEDMIGEGRGDRRAIENAEGKSKISEECRVQKPFEAQEWAKEHAEDVSERIRDEKPTAQDLSSILSQWITLFPKIFSGDVDLTDVNAEVNFRFCTNRKVGISGNARNKYARNA